MARFDGLILDFDGVLIDSEFVGNAHLAQVLTALGHPIDPEEAMARFMGLAGIDFIDAIERWMGGKLPTDFARMRADEDARALAEGIAEVAGAAAFLAALPSDLPVAIASSSSTHWIRTHLEHLFRQPVLDAKQTERVTPAFKLFGHIYSGREHVSHGKPAPDIYLHAAAALGVPIDRCAIVEDSPVGATGAVKTGAFVIGLVAGSHCGPDHAARLKAIGVDAIAHNFEQVRALLGL